MPWYLPVDGKLLVFRRRGVSGHYVPLVWQKHRFYYSCVSKRPANTCSSGLIAYIIDHVFAFNIMCWVVVALLLLIFLCFCVRVVQLGYIYIYVYSLPGEYWYSSAVTKRIEERKVSTATGSIILRGTLDARLADKHGLNVVVVFSSDWLKCLYVI